MEGRDVATADIPGAFLKTDYNKGDIRINMEGEMVTIQGIHLHIKPQKEMHV